jgi:hypothetical protein
MWGVPIFYSENSKLYIYYGVYLKMLWAKGQKSNILIEFFDAQYSHRFEFHFMQLLLQLLM